MVMPGDNVTATFELITPVAMEPGAGRLSGTCAVRHMRGCNRLFACALQAAVRHEQRGWRRQPLPSTFYCHADVRTRVTCVRTRLQACDLRCGRAERLSAPESCPRCSTKGIGHSCGFTPVVGQDGSTREFGE